jgi:hypothetical protein
MASRMTVNDQYIESYIKIAPMYRINSGSIQETRRSLSARPPCRHHARESADPIRMPQSLALQLGASSLVPHN